MTPQDLGVHTEHERMCFEVGTTIACTASCACSWDMDKSITCYAAHLHNNCGMVYEVSLGHAFAIPSRSLISGMYRVVMPVLPRVIRSIDNCHAILSSCPSPLVAPNRYQFYAPPTRILLQTCLLVTSIHHCHLSGGFPRRAGL